MRNLSKDEQARIEAWVSEMSLEEKMAQLTGIGAPALLDEQQRVSDDLLAEHLGNGIGQITISAGGTTLPPERTIENANRIQEFLTEKTRHGIPAIFNDECIAGFVGMGATHFPQAIGMGSAWNPALTQRMADVIGRQARAMGSHLMYSPVFDVGCDPRWGRTEETWGEDPYLVSRIGIGYVSGLQGDAPRMQVVSTLKHFAGYSASEGGRNCGPVHLGPRELRELFLLPFEAAVKEIDVESVMAAYHDIDGVPCAGDHHLLTEILRDEWGFPGIVVADWGVVQMLKDFHNTAADLTEAGKQALSAGLDIETPSAAGYTEGLIEAVEAGDFPGEIVDEALRRHLRVKTLLGLFDDSCTPSEGIGEKLDTAEDRAIALEAAQASMTLLKNDNNLLPLKKDMQTIAVIGPNADCTRALLGDYSYSVYMGERLDGDAVKIVSVLEGIRNKLGPGADVRYAEGCSVFDSATDGFDEAVQTAADADVVIAVMGGRSALHKNGTSGENLDRATLGLPGAQEELLKALHATGKPVVLVLTNGRPLAIEWAAENVPAILEAWLPGEEGGTAVADALFGDINPGGKLPVSLLRTSGQAPMPYNIRPSSLADHAKYVDSERTPVYPFGHGLSYTTFAYSALAIDTPVVTDEDSVGISCTVENTGSRPGDEIVQLYLRDPVASVARPQKELKGFARVSLEPGAGKTLTFRLPVEMLAFHDRDVELMVEPGEFLVMIGSSSEAIHLESRFEVATERQITGRQRFLTECTIA